MSYKKIMIPLDGSPFSEQALPWALTIARKAGSDVQLVQIHEPVPYAVFGEGLQFHTDAELMQEQRAHLDALAARIRAATRLRCSAALVADDSPGAALTLLAIEEKTDLMVATTHGRGPLSRLWVGSVTEELLRSAPCPVLAVRPTDEPVDWSQDKTLHHIVVALDGSSHAEHVLESTVALGALMDSTYHLVHVSTRPADMDASQTYLDDVVRRMGLRPSVVETHAVCGSHVPTRIVEVAEEIGADLISLETHGRRGFQRWRLGSVADKLLRLATLPLLTHRTPVAPGGPAALETMGAGASV